MADDEGHLLRRAERGGADQIALVLAIVIIGDDDDLAARDGFDRFRDGMGHNGISHDFAAGEESSKGRVGSYAWFRARLCPPRSILRIGESEVLGVGEGPCKNRSSTLSLRQGVFRRWLGSSSNGSRSYSASRGSPIETAKVPVRLPAVPLVAGRPLPPSSRSSSIWRRHVRGPGRGCRAAIGRREPICGVQLRHAPE